MKMIAEKNSKVGTTSYEINVCSEKNKKIPKTLKFKKVCFEMQTCELSLCDISKLSKSSNIEILNYRYRDIDSCLTVLNTFPPHLWSGRGSKSPESKQKKTHIILLPYLNPKNTA
jgi:hypothetical protein